MPGTFSQIYIQVVFAVKGRENLIGKQWKDELHKYIAGIIKGKEQKPIIINGMADHIHAFIGLRPSMAISDFVRDMIIEHYINKLERTRRGDIVSYEHNKHIRYRFQSLELLQHPSR